MTLRIYSWMKPARPGPPSARRSWNRNRFKFSYTQGQYQPPLAGGLPTPLQPCNAPQQLDLLAPPVSKQQALKSRPLRPSNLLTCHSQGKVWCLHWKKAGRVAGGWQLSDMQSCVGPVHQPGLDMTLHAMMKEQRLHISALIVTLIGVGFPSRAWSQATLPFEICTIWRPAGGNNDSNNFVQPWYDISTTVEFIY